jgi:hypothetical protein
MLHQNNLRRLFVSTFLFASVALAQQPAAVKQSIETTRLRAHVTYLASDKLEGRKTGSPGAEAAAAYIMAEFKRLGLAPGGDPRASSEAGNLARLFTQKFPYVAGVELGKGNAMTLSTRAADVAPSTKPATLDLRAGEDWMPLGFSSNARVENAPVVFVGYGITAADQNYDDYKGADARDKVALALAGTPDGDNPHGKFTRAGEIRFKAAAARAAGAKALVIVAGEDNFKDDRLARLSFDNAGGDAGISVVVISRQVAARASGVSVPHLAEFEKKFREWKSSAQGVSVTSGYSVALNVKPTMNVTLNLSTDIVRREAPAANVIGVLEGADPKLKNEVIVVGAHYDHLGHGGQGSLAAREGEIHHGADDNASGTAGLLELARALSAERAKLRRTVVFIAFGGEEEGLLGSSHYVNHPSFPLEQTVAMINMDMVGRLREGALMIGGVGTATEWRGWLEAANNELNIKVNVAGAQGGHGSSEDGAARVSNARAEMPIVTGADGRTVATASPARRFNLRLNEDGFGPSDHSSFYAKRVPVLFFFTGSHEDYHKPSDTADRINHDGLASIVEFVRDIVSDLQASDKRPTFTLAKVEATARSTGFRVYLGTVPSYAESTDGMKLDAVREGSPAEKAGLKAGDRIVKMAGREVRNVYDYTQALSEMKAGEEYDIEIVRAGQTLTLKVTPAARK